MARMHMTIDIDLAPEQTFEMFIDFDKAAERIAGIEELTVLTAGPIGVGTRFSETRTMFNKRCTEEMEITAYEPGKHYSLGCESCGCSYNSTFSFKPKGSGTEVHIDMTSRPVSLFAKLMLPLSAVVFGPMMKKCVARDMADMQTAAQNMHTASQ